MAPQTGLLVRIPNLTICRLHPFRIKNHIKRQNTRTYIGSTNQTGKSLDDYIKTFNLATHIVEPWALKQPDHPALMITDGNLTQSLSYSELLQQSNQLAAALCNQEKPCPKCSVVVLSNIIPWWVLNVAGSLCEMGISPGTQMLAEKDIIYRLEMCEADAIFCDSSIMQKIDHVTRHIPWRVLVAENEKIERKSLREGWLSYHDLLTEGSSLPPVKRNYKGDSIAQLYFTSGTTGTPKMVPHTQVGLGIGHETASRDWLDLKTTDLMWNLSDLGWAKATYSTLYAPLIAGSTIFSFKMPKFDCRSVLKTLEDFPVTVMCIPPTAMRTIIQEDLSRFKPRSLRKCVSAGEPLNPEVVEVWQQYTGLWIHEGYGQTESTLVSSSIHGMKVKPGTMGKPVNGFDVKIVDENFKELGPKQEGQIAYSLKNGWPFGLFKGYLKNPELNKKVFSNGYYLTGDKACFDEEGYICYVGRDDDIINSAGYRIGPFEVESALIEHPSILESAAVASPDEQRGHVVKAFVVLKQDHKDKIKTKGGHVNLVQEIQDYVKKVASPYKYPRKIEFVDSLPKTNSGKIRRIELRERENKIKENK